MADIIDKENVENVYTSKQNSTTPLKPKLASNKSVNSPIDKKKVYFILF